MEARVVVAWREGVYTDELVFILFSTGPVYREGELELGPDVVIALEGLGTFQGVSIRDRVLDALSKGKDLSKIAAKVHRESTRRGHASLTTSAVMFWEVSNCSRLLSMLLVAPVFGSYLQESQRRAPLTRERLLTPAELRNGKFEGRFSKVMDRCFEAYKTLCGEGVPLEDARYLSPLAAATSLYASLSLESHIYFIRKVEDGVGIVSKELRAFVNRFLEMASGRIPLLLDSRLSFKARWGYYSATDPLREPDGLIQRLCGDRPSEEAELLSFDYPRGIEDIGHDGLAAEQASPLVRALTVESLSLAAYHQAIRHRTVPTVVESLVEAAERWSRSPEKGLVVPPSIKSSPKLSQLFTNACEELHTLYSTLMQENEVVAALYTLPNAMRIRVVRSYNLYNILSPMGFLATRTCSAAQWEERAIAYKLWREVEKAAPWLKGVMGEKCKHLGYCPEKEWCPIILKYWEYSDELHRKYNQ
ncbi:Flavin-dependent thymidylate synthase [Candidatus Calditenuaceae archaeon HR02]|nr:Flavin-dependent thymidylate synthase [Candidatus Calditenuaceae archaeon HR02]